jgi:Fur family transcriptional regulator, zinc uptake regulator
MMNPVPIENQTAEVLEQVKRAGYKFTGKRETVIHIFVANKDKYVTAKDVYTQVKEKYPNVSYDTIYRTLTLLHSLGVIEEMEFSEDAARYRLRCVASHHHHMVCVRCGNITPLGECPMDLMNSVVPTGHQIVSHKFEINVVCPTCQ